MSNVHTIPWCEKYRPTQFQQIIMEPINRTIFENIIETQTFPNLLFYGPPGVGKTTSADNLIYAYQKKYHRLRSRLLKPKREPFGFGPGLGGEQPSQSVRSTRRLRRFPEA